MMTLKAIIRPQTTHTTYPPVIPKDEPEDPQDRVVACEKHDDGDGHESTGDIHQDKGDDVVTPVPVKHQRRRQDHK